jgi:hypothetical protein
MSSRHRPPRHVQREKAAPPVHPPGTGRPLEPSVRQAMEPRFGHSFGAVRVHVGPAAGRAAAALAARAYTLGNDIVFADGQYKPAGDALLAHELAHVVQQKGFAATEEPRLGDPNASSERAVDAAIHDALTFRSPALSIRQQLRAAAPAAATIQRAVTTWGGEFDTDVYKLLTDPGVDGVEIELRFKPNEKVDAKKIGMLQTARAQEKGTPVAIGTGAEQATLKSRMIQAGRSGAGTAIDHLATHGTPLYAEKVPAPGARLGATPTNPDWGRHGWRFLDTSGALQKRDALLKDKPKLRSTRVESEQTFESTALAVGGTQEGTYYGSVSWGWTKNAAGLVSKLPFTRVSKDAPSNVFNAAAQVWNASTTSTGTATIDLPFVTRGYARADDTPVVGDPTDPVTSELGKTAKNDRVEVTSRARRAAFNVGAAVPWWKVTVVSGAQIGKVGWTLSSGISPDEVK